jgi:hypothetical protein
MGRKKDPEVIEAGEDFNKYPARSEIYSWK